MSTQPRPGPQIVQRGRVVRPLILAATVLGLTLGAQASVPMVPVPMTLQTLALVVGAALLGPLHGPMAVLLYLALAMAGLPVLSGWTAAPGAAILELNTLGYLAGFVVAAWLVGRGALACEQIGTKELPPRQRPSLARSMVGAHVVILVLGMAWLARDTGWAVAFREGVRPFVIGAVVKSLVGAMLVFSVVPLLARAAGRSDSAA